MKKVCTGCKELLPLADFNYRDKRNARKQSRCRRCTRTSGQAAYAKHRQYYLQRVAQRNLEVREELRRFIYRYLCDNSCVDCGVDNPVVLQFDHVKGKKRLSIASMVNRRYSLASIKAEIEKCQVRCANCHTRKTVRSRRYYKYFDALD